jgi:membrane protein
VTCDRPTSPGRPRFRRRDFALELLRRSLSEFFDDGCPQLAASISYHVLFSLFPLTMMVAGGASVVLNTTGSRAAAVDAIVRNLPLSAHGADQVRSLLLGATTSTASLGLLGVVGLVYAASGVMAALRAALNRAWDVEQARPFLKGKLVDLGLVLLVATLGLGSLALTVAAGMLGHLGGLPGWAADTLRVAFPLGVALATVLFLYRVVPAAAVRVREVWPAAVVVAILVVAAQNLFALYVRSFGHYNAIYGSLGAVIAFMFFVYLSAEFLLLGAEAASEWPRIRGRLERREAASSTPLGQQLKAGLRGLWVGSGQAMRNPRDGSQRGHPANPPSSRRDRARGERGKRPETG